MNGNVKAVRQAVRPLRQLEKTSRFIGAEAEVVEADDEVENEVVEHGKREVAKMNDPKLPSKAEIDNCNLSHLPRRCWRRHCVRGWGEELPHFSVARSTDMREFHFDWAFPGEEEAGKQLTVLVGK